MSSLRLLQPDKLQEADPESSGLQVVVVKTLAELDEHVPAWTQLAENSLEANVFYEPAMLRPAMQFLARGARLEFLLIYDSLRQLHGFFPLQRVQRIHGLPLRCVSLWQYEFCYMCCPLIRANRAQETLNAFLDWSQEGPRSQRLVKLPLLPGGGPFHDLLITTLLERGLHSWVSRQFSRPHFRLNMSWEGYAHSVLSRNLRKQLRRHERRLAQSGSVTHRFLTPADDTANWLDQFLALESAGWKGQRGSAMASSSASREFLLHAAMAAAAEQRLLMSALELDGQPVAMHCDFLAQDGCFGFKSCYDETRHACSPGTVLDLRLLRELHERRDIRWIDSCASFDHTVFTRIYNERRPMTSLWLSTGSTGTNLALSLLPLTRLLSDAVPGRNRCRARREDRA